MNVQFEREAKVELPSITLCTNISYAARYDYLSSKYGQPSANFSDSPDQKWLFNEHLRRLPLREQLLNATITGHQFFNSCKVMKPISMEGLFVEDYIGCENISKVEESVDKHRKCFTLFSQNNGQNENNYRIDHDIILRDNAFPLYQIILNNR